MNPQRSTTTASKRSTYANRTKSVAPAKRVTTTGRKTSVAGVGQNHRRSSTTGNELRPVAEIKNKAMLRRQIERINAFLDSQQATDEYVFSLHFSFSFITLVAPSTSYICLTVA